MAIGHLSLYAPQDMPLPLICDSAQSIRSQRAQEHQPPIPQCGDIIYHVYQVLLCKPLLQRAPRKGSS
jgi:hypothetical protein